MVNSSSALVIRYNNSPGSSVGHVTGRALEKRQILYPLISISIYFQYPTNSYLRVLNSKIEIDSLGVREMSYSTTISVTRGFLFASYFEIQKILSWWCTIQHFL